MPIPEPIDWSQAYARVQRLADRDVLVVLRRAYRDINRMLREIERRPAGVGNMVREEQLRTVKRSLLRAQAEIFRKMGDIIRARRLEAAARAIQLGSAIDDVLFAAAGRTDQARALKASLLTGLESSVEVAMVRMGVSAVPLAERIYRTAEWMNGRLDLKINSALARGLNAREFAKEARDWFNPDVPGGTRYAAYRLARSEINNAYHAMSVANSAEKPWIEGMKWHLSRSHPRPDVCDEYARGGREGNGVYRPQDVPRKPHPHCFCFVTPESPDEDEFLDNLVAGRYNGYLDQKLGRASTARTSDLPTTLAPTARSKTAKAPAKPKPVSQPKAPKAPVLRPASQPLIKGKDRVGDLKRDWKELYGDPRVDSSYDMPLERMGKKQGFSNRPIVASTENLDQAIAKGWTEVFRGLRSRLGVTSFGLADEFRFGSYQPGRGIYGNGFYTSVRRKTGEAYADRFKPGDNSGTLLRMAIDPKAKVVEYERVQKEMRAWLKTQKNGGNLKDEDLRYIPTEADVGVIRLINNDEGRFAAMKGYDVIRVVGRDDGAEGYVRGEKRADQYIVLNRSALMVEEVDL